MCLHLDLPASGDLLVCAIDRVLCETMEAEIPSSDDDGDFLHIRNKKRKLAPNNKDCATSDLPQAKFVDLTKAGPQHSRHPRAQKSLTGPFTHGCLVSLLLIFWMSVPFQSQQQFAS